MQSVASSIESRFSIDDYLRDCRESTLGEIQRHLPRDTRHTAGLYDLMCDYPFRPAKGLRPALCIGVCRALGGDEDRALASAAAFELFHNAFLVHDDIEDDSLLRRNSPTLHAKHGVPIAVNVGDGMLAIALEPLLDNVRVLGLGPALRIFRSFARMTRESVEGQMIELSWIRERRWNLADREYLRMVHKKTGWYSFISPVQVGAIAAGADLETVDALGRFALSLGVAFQIQDDLLSLEGDVEAFGKDAKGDLWEGKYTLALLHALRSVSASERQEGLAILARPRPDRSQQHAENDGASLARSQLLQKITTELPHLDHAQREMLTTALVGSGQTHRDAEGVKRLHEIVTGRGGASLTHARNIAVRFAHRSLRVLDGRLSKISDSIHKRFLRKLAEYVIRRTH